MGVLKKGGQLAVQEQEKTKDDIIEKTAFGQTLKLAEMVGLFFFNFYLFIYGCVGSSSLCEGLLQLRKAGATLHCSAWAPHHRGLSRCGAQAPDAQAQQLWLTGPAAPQHAGSPQTRARTRVPRTSRQTPNHCATREAQRWWF